MGKRTAVDILLHIEDQINLLVGLAKNIDSNLKTLLSQKNSPTEHKIQVTASDTKAAVQQQILYKSNQRPAVLVDIRAFDQVTQSLIGKTLTNPDGKWNLSLPLGSYNLEIKKGPSAGQPGFIERLELKVENSKPMILEKLLV